jgi:PAS domain-containing protein
MLVLSEGESAVPETFRLIEKQLAIGCWSWDIRSAKMEWSRGYYDLLGLEPGSITPSFEVILNHTHPDDRVPQAEIERVIREALSVRRKFRVIQPGGNVVWIFCQISVLVNAEGVSVKAIGVCTDVTVHQQSMSPLRVADERYRALVKATGGLVWVAKSDGSVKESPNWAEHHPEPVAAVLSDRWLELLHPDDRDRATTAFNEAKRAKQDYCIDVRVRQSDRSHVWKRLRVVPILDDAGEVKEWLGVNSVVQCEKLGLIPGVPKGRITGAQIRAARGLLRWSAEKLAEAASTSRATIRRLEETDGPLGDTEDMLVEIESALTKAGVEFLFPEIGKPGIRPR